MSTFDSDYVEKFLESIIDHSAAKGEELTIEIDKVTQWPGKQVVKTSITEELGDLISILSEIKTQSRTVLKADLYKNLVQFYVAFVEEMYYYFNGNIQRTSVYVLKGFQHLDTEPGDNHNTPLRYLEEALAQHLQEDEDFLGTFLRAVFMLEEEHTSINAFSIISGDMINTETDEPLTYNDWLVLLERSRIRHDTSQDHETSNSHLEPKIIPWKTV